jgi:hypothetical protein
VGVTEAPQAEAVTTRKSPCGECGRETTHYVRCKTKRGDEEDGFSWSQASYFLECGGCHATSVRKEYWDDNYSYPDEPEVLLFPAAVARPKPPWLWQVDPRFRRLIEEVYAGLGAGTVALPVMGARAILDLVIRDKVGNRQKFSQGLDALTDKGLISKHDRGILDAAVEAGNAAAHRGFFPKAADAQQVLEIVEHLVSSLYVLKPAAKGLKMVTPKQRRRAKRTARSRVAKPAAADGKQTV